MLWIWISGLLSLNLERKHGIVSKYRKAKNEPAVPEDSAPEAENETDN